MKILECVPNISEGRDHQKIEAIVQAVQGRPGVTLLDTRADADRNRTVITYIGEPEALYEATLALCLCAFALIDMRGHSGAHPRMGAVDVVPFVPLGDTTIPEAVALARRLGEAIGREGVPVYYYEEAATSPERRELPNARRGEYEGLEARLLTDEGQPDAGPAVFNARTGAVIVGARFPLIAFNVTLDTADLFVGDRVAKAVRHISGGYRYVKAMGVELKDKGQVQVSMNLVRYDKTPIHRVLETIRFEAARYGASVVGCELIGLAPLAAFEETIRFYLQIHDFSLDRVIETHLLGSGSLSPGNQ